MRPADFRWRVENWGLHPDNCRVIGMAYSDLLLAPQMRHHGVGDDRRLQCRAGVVEVGDVGAARGVGAQRLDVDPDSCGHAAMLVPRGRNLGCCQ